MISAPTANSRGFTIVELVITIVLVGILGVVAMSRLMSPSAFNPMVTRDALISTARGAQQLSLGRGNVSLVIAPSGSDWIFSALSGATAVRSTTVNGNGVTLGTAFNGSCASPSTPLAGNFTVNYDGYGNVASYTGSATPPASGIRLCINDNVIMSVCISPAGYAHEGNCRD